MAMTMQIQSDIVNSPTATSNISQRRPTQVSLDDSSDSENEDTTPYRLHFIVTNPDLQSETSSLNTVEHTNNDNDNTEQENSIVNNEHSNTTEHSKEPATITIASLNIIESSTNLNTNNAHSTTTTAATTATNNDNDFDDNETSKKDVNEKTTFVQTDNSSTSTTNINNETLKHSIQETTANLQQQQNNNDEDKIINNSVSNGLIRRETKVLINDSLPSPVAAPLANLYTIPDIEIQPHPQRASVVEPVSTQNINRNVIIGDSIKNHNFKGDDDDRENISSPPKSIIINTIRPRQDQDQTTSTIPPPVPIKDHLLKQKDNDNNDENKTIDQLLVREANNVNNRHSQSSLYMEDTNSNNNNNNPRNSINTIESHDDDNKKRPLSSSSATSSQQQQNILTADLAASGNTNKYNRASHSLTKSVEAIKLYREMAEKTNNVQVQLSFAKYLLEVAELYRPVIEENRNGNNKDDFLNKKKALEEEGVRWIHLLSKKGVGEAAYLEAVWMEEDLHGYKTRFKFKIDKLYQTAIQAGVPEASYRMALRMENAGNENTHDIFELYLKSANQNCIQAIYVSIYIYIKK